MIKHICDKCGTNLDNKNEIAYIDFRYTNTAFQFEVCSHCADKIRNSINTRIKKIK